MIGKTNCAYSASYSFQRLSFHCNNSPITENLCYRIITQIFSTSECGLSSELYDTFKDDSIIAFFNFFNSNEGDPSKANQWSPLCTFNQDLAMQRLDSVVSLNLFISVVHVLDPYCDRTLSEAQRWENYYNRFSKHHNASLKRVLLFPCVKEMCSTATCIIYFYYTP